MEDSVKKIVTVFKRLEFFVSDSSSTERRRTKKCQAGLLSVELICLSEYFFDSDRKAISYVHQLKSPPFSRRILSLQICPLSTFNPYQNAGCLSLEFSLMALNLFPQISCRRRRKMKYVW